jgi:hypothetical protein
MFYSFGGTIQVMKFSWNIYTYIFYAYILALFVQSGYFSYYGLNVTSLNSSIFFDIFFLKLTLLHIFSAYIVKHQVFTVLGFVCISLAVKISPRSVPYFLLCTGIALLFMSQTIGMEIAKRNTSFYSFKKECSPFALDKGVQYVAPIVDFERNRAVFIALNTNNFLQKSFIVAPITQSVCQLEMKSIIISK